MLSLIAVPIAFVLVFVSTPNAAEDKPSPTIERACSATQSMPLTERSYEGCHHAKDSDA